MHRVLQENDMYPFHYRKVQHLEPGDPESRMQFCNFINAEIGRDDVFHRRIAFSDECTFTREGMFNQRNSHFWADVEENPHVIHENNFQTRWKINVWAAIINDRLVRLQKIWGPLISFKNLLSSSDLSHLPWDFKWADVP